MSRRLGALVLVIGLALGVTLQAAYTKFEAVTVAASAIGFTAAHINNTVGAHPAATDASCRLETAQIRWTIDGTTPTTTVGILLEIGDVLTLAGNDTLNNFRAIRTGGSSGQLDCHYSGPY